MIKRFSLKCWLLVLLLMSNSLFAFSHPEIFKDGKIKGIIIDKQTNEPVEYATIAMYQRSDNKLITGTITDFNGHFKLENLEFGSYYIVISFIGYEELKVDQIKIDNVNSNINLGNIFLNSLAKELEEFEVVGKKASIEFKIDKKVINVDKQLTAESGTAIDVLENVPSVQVDVEGNVTLRGSSGFTVLIDGKPTILDPSDVLRQIPSSSIENIEIITNPSVKYNPDGATGIINVITKKNPFEGISGIINANLGNFSQYGGDIQLNYRLNKVNFVFAANYNKNTRPGYSIKERMNSSNDSVFYLNSYGESDRYNISKNVRGGFEYSISKNDFFSLSGTYGIMDMNRSSQLRYDDYTFPESIFISYNSLDQTKRDGDYYNLDLVYQHDFPKKKKKESVDSDVKDEKGSDGPGRGKAKKPGFSKANLHYLKLESGYQYRNMDEITTSQISTLSDILIGGKKNVEVGPSESFNINLDYSLPVKEKDKFEAGLGFRGGTSIDETELWLYNEFTGEIEFIDQFSNYVEYYRNIYSAYGLYAGLYKKLGYQLGLRTEYTNRKIEAVDFQNTLLKRWDYFPTLHLSYDLEKDQQVMASYSRRIERPRGYWLEPFVTWQDAYNARQGNPDLLPEYIDSYEMAYIKNFGENFLSLEGYYRVTNNKVERISTVYTDIALLAKFENVGQDFSLGIEAMLNLTVTDWWDMELSANFFNYKIEGELVYNRGEDDQVVEPLNRSSTNWNSRFNNTFKLWKDGVIQLNSRYNSSSVYAQGVSSGFYTLDAAFKVLFLNKSLSANLQGRNLLGTARREYTSEGLGFNFYTKYEPNFPQIVLSLSYRFNNFKQNRRTSRSGDGSEDDF